MDFTDKCVLITGSSRGIGFDIAKTFIDAGARVGINGRTTQSVSVAIERLGDGERLVSAPRRYWNRCRLRVSGKDGERRLRWPRHSGE